MRVKFLVVLAVICLCAHYASASGGMGDKGKKDAAPKPEAAPKPQSSEYEVEVIKHKKEKTEKKEKEKKTHIEFKKVTKKSEKKFVPCSEKVNPAKLDCETSTPAGYKPNFTYKDNEDCDWDCAYDALPAPPGEKRDDKKEKKLIKIKKPKAKTPKKPKKVCSGEKVIRFQNCLVKIRGLIAFGDKTKNFDKKFAKLVQGKAKKGAKKANGGKKGGKKNPKAADKPANPPAPTTGGSS